MGMRPTRSKLILAATVALVVAVVVLLWKSRAGSDGPAVVSPAASGGDGTVAAGAGSAGASSNGSPPTLDNGNGAPVADPSDLPPERPRRPSEGLDPRDVPEPTGVANVARPSEDVTPSFRLEKTAHMIDLLQTRAERVEKGIAAAEQAGKEKEAAKGRIVLQRLRQRISAVKQELADDKAGNPPTEGDDKRAGQPPPMQREFAPSTSNQ